MLNWFEKEAPIRAKFRALLVVNGVWASLALIATICAADGWLSVSEAIGLAALMLVATISTVMLAANKICTPYVNMVTCIETSSRVIQRALSLTRITAIASAGSRAA